MAKEPNTQSANAPLANAPAPADDAFPLTLEEFCTRLSSTDRRVELIGGFEHAESIAGRVKDLEASFAIRFAAFANQPA